MHRERRRQRYAMRDTHQRSGRNSRGRSQKSRWRPMDQADHMTAVPAGMRWPVGSTSSFCAILMSSGTEGYSLSAPSEAINQSERH